ncbi:hypothetical protein A9Q99_07645 [Gammaproteobacteria bacterium 45_16_T64]|nr:hypothetical protein A9Q99_07645 [Gammaproteobacteria bacterium 45_16_T64]
MSPLEREWKTLRIYLFYRLILSISLLTLYLLSPSTQHLPSESQWFVLGTTIGYIVLCCYQCIATRKVAEIGKLQVFLIVAVDVVCVALLEFINSPEGSNLSILLIVTVAAGSILVVGRLSLLFAAMATWAIFFRNIEQAITTQHLNSEDFLQSGFLGIACFLTAIIAQQLANRLRESEALASSRAIEVANLEELNKHIIQRMRTGIVVVDSNYQVLMINDACWRLLGMPEIQSHTHIENLSPELSEHLLQWKESNHYRSPPFKASISGPEVQTNFTLLKSGADSEVLIFVDDNTRMAQQAQQLKLASLGGLTASIAHEIRNPLGAISHAAQLLHESPELASEDVRLTEIIQQHSQRMNKVIENVLQLSRRNPAQPQIINLHQWLSEFIDEFAHTLSSPADIHFQSTRTATECRADPSQIQQVLSNLFINGLRYNEKQTGKRELWVVADISLQTEQPYVEIIDKGPGIPEDTASKIFEPFYTTDKTGTGLGLYISKELCEANQARLDYIPITTGSCFRITFSHPGRQTAL